MATFITVLVILAFIAEVGIGTILFWIILGIAILFGFVWIIVSWLEKRGYITYGRYYTYWHPTSNSRNTTHHDHSFWSHQDSEESFLPNVPTPQNEDGDWRTVYMDDTRYYDRECDEEFDHDREDNGGW